MSENLQLKHRYFLATENTVTPAVLPNQEMFFQKELSSAPTIQLGACFVSDTLHRKIYDTSTKSLTVGVWQTREVEARILAWGEEKDRDIAILKSVANWQRKYINYQATYSAYLLGALTEEEFELESSPYISEIKEVPPSELVPAIGRVKRLLDFDLGESELAEFFEVDAETVSLALSYWAHSPEKELASLENVWQNRPGIEE
jgi:hypothetical protein